MTYCLMVNGCNSLRDKVGEFDNDGQSGSLQCGMAVAAGKVNNAGNCGVSNMRKFFLYSDSRKKRTCAKRNISNVLTDAERGINCNNERLIKSILNLCNYRGKIDSVYRGA